MKRRAMDIEEAAQGVRTRATNASVMTTLQNMLRMTKNPQAVRDMAPELAAMSGQSPDLITRIIDQLTPATEVVRDTRVAEDMPLIPQGEVGAATLTNQNLGQLALSGEIANLPPEILRQGAEIKLGTQLSDSEDASNKLGWATFRQRERQLDDEWKRFQTLQNAALAEAQEKHKEISFEPIMNALNGQRQMFADMTAKGTTLTKDGWMQYALGINGFNRILEANDPGRREMARQAAAGEPITAQPTFPVADLDPLNPYQYLRGVGLFEDKPWKSQGGHKAPNPGTVPQIR